MVMWNITIWGYISENKVLIPAWGTVIFVVISSNLSVFCSTVQVPVPPKANILYPDHLQSCCLNPNLWFLKSYST